MKKSTKRILFIAGAAAAGMYAYNRFVASSSTKKNLLAINDSSTYEWKEGKIFYTKRGSGSPVLLIHDINPSSSSYEWKRVIKRLEKEHTVYAIDLLGCGRSDKPEIIYTNYLYVQMITSFVKNVIGSKTDVVASNMAVSFVIMANQMDASLFNKLIFVNPVSIKKLQIVPDDVSRAKRILINLPLVGTFIYNIMVSPMHIDYAFRKKYFSDANYVKPEAKDTFYESAHAGDGKGKYLYSSLLGDFVNVDIANALKKIENPVYLIGSRGVKNNPLILQEYHKMNSSFITTMIPESGLYPQFEIPDKITSIIKKYLSE